MKKSLKEKVIEKLKKIGLCEDGTEKMDPKPNRVKLGLGKQKAEPLHEMVKRMIRETTNQHAMETGEETFEEANDFDIEDEFTIETPYERHFDSQVPDSVMEQHIASINSRISELQAKMEKNNEQSIEIKSSSTPDTELDS